MSATAARRPVRILSLVVAAALSGCGDGEGDARPPGPPPATEGSAASSEGNDRPAGRWFELRESRRDAIDDSNDPLAGIGYAGAYSESDARGGVVVHDAERVQPGLTLVCSGHAPTVLLMDADGELQHEWSIDFEAVFPEWRGGNEKHCEFVRRAHPFPNGDLLVVFEYIGIARVDRDGTPIWSDTRRHHHDFEVLEDGSIVALTATTLSPAKASKKYGTRRFSKGVLDNEVVLIDEGGTELRRISLIDAFLTSDYRPALAALPTDQADIFHANSVDWIDERAAAASPVLDEGDILVSLRTPSAVVAIDGDSGSVKWMAQGPWLMQHQAVALENGHILLLDNRGGFAAAPFTFNHSRIVEWSPKTLAVEWQYPARGEDADFFTLYLGYVQRLANGNTLVTESTQGRLFELSTSGDIVWEYVSPFRAGENDELITTLMGGRRLAPEELPFLD